MSWRQRSGPRIYRLKKPEKHQQPLEAREAFMMFFHGLEKEPTPLTSRSWTVDFWNCRRLHSCCWKPPSLCWFVPSAMGSQYTQPGPAP